MPSLELLQQGVWGRFVSGPTRARPMLFGICSVVLVRADRILLFHSGHFGTRLHLRAALETAGLVADEVDIVVLSHLHWDQRVALAGDAVTTARSFLERRPRLLFHGAEAALPNPHSASLLIHSVRACEEPSRQCGP